MIILDHFDHQEKKQAKEHFMNLIQVAMADGIVDQKETEMLHRFGRKMGFTDPEVDNLIEAAAKSDHNPPHEFSKRFEQVYDIVKMILADGIIDENEMRLARGFATKSGFTENEVPRLLEMLINGIKQGIDEDDLFIAYKKQRMT